MAPKFQKPGAQTPEDSIKPYSVGRDPRGNITVSADGLEDHQMAMEAIKMLPEIQSPATVPAASLTPTAKRIPMDEAISKWAQTMPRKSARDKTPQAKIAPVREFRDWKGSTRKKNSVSKLSVSDITRVDCGEWKLNLKQRPGLKKNTKQADSTIDNKMGYLESFFAWAIGAGYYPQGDNPAGGHGRESKKSKRMRSLISGWKPFTPEQLTEIFTAKAIGSMKSDGARWLPIIALYTGARSNEIAQLELADFTTKQNVAAFTFTVEGDDKSIKEIESVRTTPIHPDLVTLGLLKRVERLRKQKQKKLFPDLNFDTGNGPANAPQKAFSRLLKKQKIGARGQGRLGMHSFRKTVTHLMQDKGIGPDLRKAFIGHDEGQGDNIHELIYSKAVPIRMLVEKCLPALDWQEQGIIEIDSLNLLLNPKK